MDNVVTAVDVTVAVATDDPVGPQITGTCRQIATTVRGFAIYTVIV